MAPTLLTKQKKITTKDCLDKCCWPLSCEADLSCLFYASTCRPFPNRPTQHRRSFKNTVCSLFVPGRRRLRGTDGPVSGAAVALMRSPHYVSMPPVWAVCVSAGRLFFLIRLEKSLKTRRGRQKHRSPSCLAL